MNGPDEPKQMSEEEKARFIRADRLLRAWSDVKPTTVDGVYFDLRCDVDKALWRPLASLGLYGRRAALYGPEFIFPWTPAYVREFMETLGPGFM